MAHKHNRRRVRPRHRSHSPSGSVYDISEPTSFNSSAPLPRPPTAFADAGPPPYPSFRSTSATSSVAARHWQNRYVAWQHRDVAQKREADRIEAEKLRLFGGEPGDDVGLCSKMLEVFEAMDWINSLE